MSGIFLLEMVGLLFFVQLWFFSANSSYALAVSALVDTSHTAPGQATTEFINGLKDNGFKSITSQKIKRTPFSVKGVLIGLNGDNVEVFEYPDHDTALNEGMMLAQKYTKNTVQNQWKNTIHLYIRDKIIIFYMGTEKDILATLEKNQEFSMVSPAIAGPRLSD